MGTNHFKAKPTLIEIKSIIGASKGGFKQKSKWAALTTVNLFQSIDLFFFALCEHEK